MTRAAKEHGFTLVELSIVLVIIGLIVGGVLVGTDLVKTAQLRATVQQVEKFNTAVNAFKGKYGCLPGDCRNPAGSGLFANGMTGTCGLGNANGLIESVRGGCPNPGGFTYPDGESLVFWRHLSDAGLVEGTYGLALGAAGGEVGANTTTDTTAQYLPLTKLGRNTYFMVYGMSGLNFFQTARDIAISVGASYTDSPYSLTPAEALFLDTKMDDGLPVSGIVQAKSGAVYLGQAPISGCLNAALTLYNITYANLGCAIAFQFQ